MFTIFGLSFDIFREDILVFGFKTRFFAHFAETGVIVSVSHKNVIGIIIWGEGKNMKSR